MAERSAPRDGGQGAQGEELSFEAALERLEAVVERLEDGELELESALRAFEEGVGLSRRCAKQLEDAERRVELLAADGRALPFEERDI